jgi:hypothetical protein
MIRALTSLLRPTRLRTCIVASLAVLAGANCGGSDPMSNSDEAPTPVVTTGTDATTQPVTTTLASVTYSGIPFGPFGLWKTATSVEWGPAPFTGSHNYSSASNIVTQINSARLMKQRLILAMTGGSSKNYLTNGKFDLSKWKNKINTFNTTTIRNAIAAGVSDGTIIGNTLMDEPETKQWGGVMTKPLLDQMATYAKNFFPTLPMGVNHGPPAYKWHNTERYRVVDYVLYQYAYYVTSGNISAWRDAVLSQARTDGVTPAFSMNILNGGVQDKTGTWDCAGTGGKGTRAPNCRMTPDQVRNWGNVIGVAGCALAMWQYDDAFMSKSTNVDAFRAVASTLNAKARRSCKRV